jgi:tetratricopeptide (TPR) repeat protein
MSETNMRRLAMTLAVMLAAWPAAARAADANVLHCEADDADTVIRGCTALIKAGKTMAAGNVYETRAAAYERKGRYDDAIADYDHAIALEPDSVTAFDNRGIDYGHQGQKDKAIADFRAALKIRAGDFIAKAQLEMLGEKP